MQAAIQHTVNRIRPEPNQTRFEASRSRDPLKHFSIPASLEDFIQVLHVSLLKYISVFFLSEPTADDKPLLAFAALLESPSRNDSPVLTAPLFTFDAVSCIESFNMAAVFNVPALTVANDDDITVFQPSARAQNDCLTTADVSTSGQGLSESYASDLLSGC
jgi:hypothetical protein